MQCSKTESYKEQTIESRKTFHFVQCSKIRLDFGGRLRHTKGASFAGRGFVGLREPMQKDVVEIRKYPNRRLYDTEASRYITLAEVAAMIASGRDIRVIDAKTGDDLTKATMLQIICENKHQQDALPIAFLRQIIQAGDKVIRHSIGSYLSMGLHLPREIQRQVGNIARAAMLMNPFLAPFAARSSRQAGLYDVPPPGHAEDANLAVAEPPTSFAPPPASSSSPALRTAPIEEEVEGSMNPAEETAFLRQQLSLIQERLEELRRKI